MKIVDIDIIETASTAGRIKGRVYLPGCVFGVAAGKPGVVALYQLQGSNIA